LTDWDDAIAKSAEIKKAGLKPDVIRVSLPLQQFFFLNKSLSLKKSQTVFIIIILPLSSLRILT